MLYYVEKLDARALQGRAMKRKQTDASAHILSLSFKSRMIRDLLVTGRNINEGKTLGMMCPDLVNILIHENKNTYHIL